MSVAPDLVIRGGTIVDGTGAPPFVGDVAVTGALISAVGPDLPVRGKREYDARGLLVAPGWVDAHTHFDAQVIWDPYLTPSSGGGVTTCIMGNCGVGIAPCQKERRDEVITLVEAIEDIPAASIRAGIQWEWETFEEYLDAVGRRRFACDVAAMVGHSCVRSWVLGARCNASDRPGGAAAHPVSQGEIEKMAAVVRDAVAAGAMGFSTSRALYHRDRKGVLMPGSLASPDEMLALLRAIGAGGGGVFGANMDFAAYDDVPYQKMDEAKRKAHWASEWAWLNTIASESAGKTNLTFEVTSDDGVRQRLIEVERMMKRNPGLLIRTQIHARPQASLQAVDSGLNLLHLSQRFRALARERADDGAALLAQLRDTATRGAILGEVSDRLRRCIAAFKEGRGDPYMGIVMSTVPFTHIFPWSEGCEPAPEESVAAIAKRSGRKSLDVYYDVLVPREGPPGVMWRANNNYGELNHDQMYKVLQHPFTIPGVSDAGAHCSMMQDAAGPTHLLTHWARDRSRGPRLPVEFVVMKQTREVARLFGLADRGELLAGRRADINVIDLAALRQHKPYVKRDLPTGAGRWMQDVSGYRSTFVAGVETYTDGRATGALPGRLVRNPKADRSAWKGAAQGVAWRGGATGDDSPDMRAYALEAAVGGGASAQGRILRAAEETRARKPTPQSRL